MISSPAVAKVRVNVVVSGIVQGVGFRYSAQSEGQRLGLNGWVRNLHTGQVEAEAEGDEKAVADFVAWCNRGPAAASVDGVEVTQKSFEGDLRGFRITH